MSTRILVAGDHFILPSIFADAIRSEVNRAVELREYQSPWPGAPFGPIAEVAEASGSEEELIRALEGVTVHVANHAPLTRRMLETSRNLRLAVIARGGPTNANITAATENGVLVCNAPARSATAAAEHTLGLMLAVLRRIPGTHAALDSSKTDVFRLFLSLLSKRMNRHKLFQNRPLLRICERCRLKMRPKGNRATKI